MSEKLLVIQLNNEPYPKVDKKRILKREKERTMKGFRYII